MILIRSPGTNYLGLSQTKGGQTLRIEFETHFTVDWVDYNLYTIKKRQLHLYSLKSPGFSKVIHNISQSARNLLVENQNSPYFIAWIANDMNIVRAYKVSGDRGYAQWLALLI